LPVVRAASGVAVSPATVAYAAWVRRGLLGGEQLSGAPGGGLGGSALLLAADAAEGAQQPTLADCPYVLTAGV
jgi:hypothetical protein